jgi:hypothetical protein
VSDLDPANVVDAAQDGANDEEDLTAAYEALAEDRRHQETERTAVNAARSSEPPPDEEAASVADDAPDSDEPTTDGSAPPKVPGVEDVETGVTALPSDQATEESPVAEPDTQTPSRRVFVIDNKEYPDPGPDLPITGARSVQAMYRDYFPGQLDNVDVAQKTRADGTVEVTFKRRIGTKGASIRSKPPRPNGGSGEVVITLASVVRVLGGLPQDRPLAWDLVEQAIGPKGAVRLDYVPPATQLNLAEAQLAARARLIELAVGELRRLRPSA